MREDILLMRFSAIGDVAMLVPVVREYLSSTPDDVRVTVLSRPFFAPLFTSLGPRCRFIGADLQGEYHGVVGLERLFQRLHAMHFTRICDMHSVLRTHFLTTLFRLWGYDVRVIDKRRDERHALIHHTEGQPLPRCTSAFDKYREVLYGKLPTGNAIADHGAVSTTAPVAPSSLTIAIAPFAAHSGKIYPTELMEQVIAMLVERGVNHIYLFGSGGQERDTMRQWQQRWPTTVTVAADVAHGLAEEMRLISTMSVMVSMDSANMHLASLAGVRVISVWGATHPAAGFLGYGQRESDCVQHMLPCRPCSIYGNKPCRYGDYRCMTLIEPREIVERIMA